MRNLSRLWLVIYIISWNSAATTVENKYQTNKENYITMEYLIDQDNYVCSIKELIDLGYIKAAQVDSLKAVTDQYPLLISRYYLSLINKDDPLDPIALMAIPRSEELVSSNLMSQDPIGDITYLKTSRLTHRYPDRALLHINNSCSMNCRFCFRKNLIVQNHQGLYQKPLDQAFNYLKNNPQVKELILSGGEPLLLTDEHLAAIIDQIELELPEIQSLRFHTRIPATLPNRITKSLIKVLGHRRRLNVVIVAHFNHPQEITSSATKALKLLRNDFLLLNQSVLLKQVNDNPDVLRSLFVQLGALGCMPYYLHHCDSAIGTEHFKVSMAEGTAIMRDLYGSMPGYLIPKYVVDLVDKKGKIPISY